MKSEKAARLSEIWAEVLSAYRAVGFSVITKLCQRVLGEKGISDEWQTSVLVSIFKEKDDVRNCNP